MKKLQRFCAAIALTLTLALTSFAGEMQFPGDVAPPPQPQNQVATAGDMQFPGVTATGDMSTPGAVAVNPVTDAALNLLQSVLSIF